MDLGIFVVFGRFPALNNFLITSGVLKRTKSIHKLTFAPFFPSRPSLPSRPWKKLIHWAGGPHDCCSNSNKSKVCQKQFEDRNAMKAKNRDDWVKKKTSYVYHIQARIVATCKPGKPGLTSFSETLALFFIQFLSFPKMKVQDRQNDPSGLPEKTGWLRAWHLLLSLTEIILKHIISKILLTEGDTCI